MDLPATNAGIGAPDEQVPQTVGLKAKKRRKRRLKAKNNLQGQNENRNHNAGPIFPSSSQTKPTAEVLSAPGTHTGQLAQFLLTIPGKIVGRSHPDVEAQASIKWTDWGVLQAADDPQPLRSLLGGQLKKERVVKGGDKEVKDLYGIDNAKGPAVGASADRLNATHPSVSFTTTKHSHQQGPATPKTDIETSEAPSKGESRMAPFGRGMEVSSKRVLRVLGTLISCLQS